MPGQSQTALRDGSTWPVGTEDEVAWINAGVTRGMSITASIPPVFAAYATLAFPLDLDAPRERLRPRVNGHRFLPTGGHLIPHWWPSFLPAGGHQISPPVAIVSPQQGVGSGSGEGLHPLAGGRLGESVALLAVGDDHVGVMQEPVDGRGRHGLWHQFVEP